MRGKRVLLAKLVHVSAHLTSEVRQVPRSVLEAKLVQVCFAAAILLVVACDPLAPLAGSEADEGGVVLLYHSITIR